jgi:hypothetical protein
MNNEVKAAGADIGGEIEAARKYRTLTYRGLGGWRSTDGDDLDTEDVNELLAVLGHSWLAEHPADEHEPLTFDAAEQILANSECGIVGRDGRVFVSLPDDVCVTSMGQLRMLCLALGIPLKASTP